MTDIDELRQRVIDAARAWRQSEDDYDETDDLVNAIDALDVVERRLIVRALASQGSVARAARCLGLGRNTLYRRLAQHGLDLPSAGAPPRVPPPLPGDFARTSPDAAPSKGDR